jgi:hypothetical protein
MARTNWSRTARPESFLDCLRYFLTPYVWRQVHQGMDRYGGSRWRPQPLVFLLLTMTWCCGESLAERFETARAFYVACYQRRRRPGKTLEGLQKALLRVPSAMLRLLAQAVRARLQQIFAKRLLVDGFIPVGCDGSSLQAPRTRELEERLGKYGKDNHPPQVRVTALVHLSLGLLWSWRLGTSAASEREHLVRLLSTLPRLALLVADAGFLGYELMEKLLANNVNFLIRLSSGAPLYAAERLRLSRDGDAVVYYWPQWAQKEGKKPLPVRVLRIRGRNGDVWLMTNVFDQAKLSRKSASTFYRWRWRNEGLFRTYKRTLGKLKLMTRGVALIHREAEGSLLAVQLLLAQGALALSQPWQAAAPAQTPPAQTPQPSARKALLEIRKEIRNVTGMYLGPRQKQSYWERLSNVQQQRRRRRRQNQVRRPWPSRAPHKPPGPPEILKMGSDLNHLAAKLLGTSEAA